ncbi:barrier-to-autointegration factor-like [Salvelinus alpinus]
MSGNKKGCDTEATSQKHGNFVSESMGNRSVKDVPGIGLVLGSRLEEQGINRAEQLLGKFLLCGRGRDIFQRYLKDTARANDKQQSDAYNAMKEWTDNNM